MWSLPYGKRINYVVDNILMIHFKVSNSTNNGKQLHNFKHISFHSTFNDSDTDTAHVITLRNAV